MLTIYGVSRSRATRPLWVLLECGQPFDHKPVIQAYRAASGPGLMTTADPAFLAVNPLGQIPAMTDGDLTLTESLAIALHIARRYGGTLGPQGDAETALAEQWALFAATAVEGPALEILYAINEGRDKGAEGQALLALNAERLRRPLARLEAHLAGASHMMGGRFTVADICVAECLRYAQGHPTLLAEYPATKAWLETCQARPAFKELIARRMSEPA